MPTTPNTQTPYTGFFQPQRFEADVYDCEVVGKIPSDMNGIFVRVGGDWYFPSRYRDDAPFNEDGYIATFRFKNGRVHYKGRWIHTHRFDKNFEADRQLYGYYRNPFTDDASVRDPSQPSLRCVANTAPHVHAGKLFALKEDGHPYVIDPWTLETKGTWDFYGKYKSQTFTAHPKIDPLTGEMICYGYEATGLCTKDVFIYTINRQGHVVKEVRIEVPYVSMIHDIALTQKHIVIPIWGYVTDMDRLKAGKIHWAYDKHAPVKVAILPRNGDAKDIRWFNGPERATVHTFNARTEGDKVILEAPIFDSNPFPFFPAVDGSAWDARRGRAFVRRQTFDLNSKREDFTEDTLFEMPVVDLGRIDERFLSLHNRFGFTGYGDSNKPFSESSGGNLKGRVTNSYGRFDLTSGKMDTYFVGETCSLQECCFVPKAGSTEEGRGYLIGMANNFAEMRSELIIADAERLSEGDIARVILPFRSSFQVHGKWIPEEDLHAPHGA